MDSYDERYPDEVLRGIDGSLADTIAALRCARHRIYEQLEKDTSSLIGLSPNLKHGYSCGSQMAIRQINFLIQELIDACVKS